MLFQIAECAEDQVVYRLNIDLHQGRNFFVAQILVIAQINGFALATWIRQEYPGVRVILTSGVNQMARNAEDVCSDGPFLEKPYSYETLAGHIRRLLTRES